jgi:ligand-binding SRPBCC domain-containing protein
MSSTYRLERSQFVGKPRAEVFAFFCDASNLEKLTPSSLQFKILTPAPIVMKPGALIDYELKLHGVPIRWKTRIEAFEPGVAFVDLQLSGPSRYWHHRHSFSDAPGGTWMNDTVDYELPFGPIGVLAHQLFVARSLQRIFDFRAQATSTIFGT